MGTEQEKTSCQVQEKEVSPSQTPLLDCLPPSPAVPLAPSATLQGEDPGWRSGILPLAPAPPPPGRRCPLVAAAPWVSLSLQLAGCGTAVLGASLPPAVLASPPTSQAHGFEIRLCLGTPGPGSRSRPPPVLGPPFSRTARAASFAGCRLPALLSHLPASPPSLRLWT